MASVETLVINQNLEIPLSELRFSFDRSPGPGGQNVNKLNTRAELRFDLYCPVAVARNILHHLADGYGFFVQHGSQRAVLEYIVPLSDQDNLKVLGMVEWIGQHLLAC